MKTPDQTPALSPASLLGVLREFLCWWREELVSLLPSSLRQHFQYSEHQLVIRFTDDAVVLADCKHGTPESSLRLSPDERGELGSDEAAALSRFVKRGRGDVAIGLDPDQVLSLSFPLPLEAEKNLHEVIGYELGRHAPFKIEQVYFAYHVVARRREEKTLRVSVTVVPRKQIEPRITMLRSWGVSPSVISVADSQGDEANGALCQLKGINLLPPAERGDTPGAMNRLEKLLVGSAVVLALVAVGYPFVHQTVLINDMRARVEAAKRDAVNVQSMRLELQKAAEQSAYVEEKKRRYPEVLDVLDTLTRLLPDDTWLENFEMKEERIRLRGLSADASSLIELLENSPLLQKVSFDSTIVKDPRIDRFRFQIVAELAAKESP